LKKMDNTRKVIGIIIIVAIVAIGALTLTSGVASAGVINVPGDYTTIHDALANAQAAHAPLEPWSFNGTMAAPFSDRWKANYQIGDFMANFRSMRTARKPAMSTALWQQEQPQTSWPSRAPVGSSGDTYNVPGDYPTIQQAIDNATGGETILVEPGRYNETVDVTVSPLLIKANSTNPADTVVSANGTDDHVIIVFDKDNFMP
jgi:pectin methylesterase-like acyl-CoA thioesterase